MKNGEYVDDKIFNIVFWHKMSNRNKIFSPGLRNSMYSYCAAITVILQSKIFERKKLADCVRKYCICTSRTLAYHRRCQRKLFLSRSLLKQCHQPYTYWRVASEKTFQECENKVPFSTSDFKISTHKKKSWSKFFSQLADQTRRTINRKEIIQRAVLEIIFFK